MVVEENIALAPLTTFCIGGPARFFVRVATVDELVQALEYARGNNLHTFILGGGSNVLVDDDGFDGLVIKIELMGVELDDNTLVAGAGEDWDALVAYAVERGLWGIENLSGIYGTVGGAVVGSIGAYGQAVAQTVEWVEVLERSSGSVRRFSNAECNFGYRESIFSAGEYVVLRAAFALHTEGAPTTTYKDLSGIARFNLAEVRERVLAIRAGKFPNLSAEGAAGSFFKNPIVSRAEAIGLQKRYPKMPLFDMPETGGTKVPLAWLLDNVLQLKGSAVGGARLYEKQPLVIVAARDARAADVRELAERVKKVVREEIGVEILEEVKILPH